MNMTVEPTAPDPFAAVTPETKTVGFANKRLNREWKTMEVMIRIHCRDHHAPVNETCAGCQQLLDYAAVRLERCGFGAEKPTCANCPVHCYQRARREQVKAVMRYAGPRMLRKHPFMGVCHWLAGLRKAPEA
ncbi:MAG: nitrous oxide-stimulated promoter family protein [Limisphaerales bacterium]